MFPSVLVTQLKQNVINDLEMMPASPRVRAIGRLSSLPDLLVRRKKITLVKPKNQRKKKNEECPRNALKRMIVCMTCSVHSPRVKTSPSRLFHIIHASYP
jgi:hypothetical protein